MKIDDQVAAERMVHFEAVCRREDFRLTHQRMEVFREVAQAEDHPDAERIFKKVRVRIPTISLDTVYRTFWLLNDPGLVVTLGNSRERTRFDANLNKHHHFVCTRCGYTRDFYSEDLNSLPVPDSVDSFGLVEGTVVEVRGICRECEAVGVSLFRRERDKKRRLHSRI